MLEYAEKELVAINDDRILSVWITDKEKDKSQLLKKK